MPTRRRSAPPTRTNADAPNVSALPERPLADDEGAEQRAPVLAVVPEPDTAAADWLWRVLIVGLVVLLVCALAGIIWTVADGNDRTSPDVIVTIFSSTLGGLFALFVRSPLK